MSWFVGPVKNAGIDEDSLDCAMKQYQYLNRQWNAGARTVECFMWQTHSTAISTCDQKRSGKSQKDILFGKVPGKRGRGRSLTRWSYIVKARMGSVSKSCFTGMGSWSMACFSTSNRVVNDWDVRLMMRIKIREKIKAALESFSWQKSILFLFSLVSPTAYFFNFWVVS